MLTCRSPRDLCWQRGQGPSTSSSLTHSFANVQPPLPLASPVPWESVKIPSGHWEIWMDYIMFPVHLLLFHIFYFFAKTFYLSSCFNVCHSFLEHSTTAALKSLTDISNTCAILAWPTIESLFPCWNSPLYSYSTSQIWIFTCLFFVVPV